jgi:hypothetical protein
MKKLELSVAEAVELYYSLEKNGANNLAREKLLAFLIRKGVALK